MGKLDKAARETYILMEKVGKGLVVLPILILLGAGAAVGVLVTSPIWIPVFIYKLMTTDE